MKPADRQLLRDVKDRHVKRHGDADGYDWNNRTGRDVTAGMRRLEHAQLVSRVGTPVVWAWRPTRLGHILLTADAVELS